jgi:hypothetical protein
VIEQERERVRRWIREHRGGQMQNVMLHVMLERIAQESGVSVGDDDDHKLDEIQAELTAAGCAPTQSSADNRWTIRT